MKIEATINEGELIELIVEQIDQYDFDSAIEETVEGAIDGNYSIESMIESKCDMFSDDIGNDLEMLETKVSRMEGELLRATETLEAMALAFGSEITTKLRADLNYQKSENASLKLQLAEVKQGADNPQI